MRRIIEFMEVEFAILEAVLSRKVRGLVLLCAAFVLPAIFLMAAMNIMRNVALPGLVDGIRPVLGLVALVLMFKLLVLATQVYLKDRAALLRT